MQTTFKPARIADATYISPYRLKHPRPSSAEKLRPSPVLSWKPSKRHKFKKQNGAERFRAVRVLKFSLGQNNLVALFQGDDGFFPVRRPAGLRGALAAEFAMHIHGVDGQH